MDFVCNFDSQGQVLFRAPPWGFFRPKAKGSKQFKMLNRSLSHLANVSYCLVTQSGPTLRDPMQPHGQSNVSFSAKE